MIRTQTSILALLLTASLAAGCATSETPASAQPDPGSFAARKAKAHELTERGDWTAALLQWRILETLDSKDAEIARKRKRIEARMRRKAQRHLDQGQEALAKRDRKIARQEFVLVLTLDPGNDEARKQLQRLELVESRRRRPRKEDRVDNVPPKSVAAVDNGSKISNPTPEQATQESVAAKRPLAVPTLEVEKVAVPLDTVNLTAKPQGQSIPSKIEPAVLDAKELAPTVSLTSESLERAKGLLQEGAYLDSIPFFLAHLSVFPEDRKAMELLAASHREVGISLYQEGQLRASVDHLEAMASNAQVADPKAVAALTAAKDQLAQETYENGVRIFREDVNQAIAFWHETLRYNPGHGKAQSYLAKAYKIQETLKALDQ